MKWDRRSLLVSCLPAAVAVLIFSPPALAYDFIPTDAEWNTWPEYCRARYSATQRANRTKYDGVISREVRLKWEQRIGHTTYLHMHHYCAGLAYSNRMRTQSVERERKKLLRKAIGEMIYTWERTPKAGSLYGEIATNLARLHHKASDTDQALTLLQEVIAAQPQFSGAYTAASLIYREIGRPDRQRSVLLQGNDAIQGESSEIHYFLGLFYTDQKEYSTAVEHARKAYALGYPLPGLRQKLHRLGYTF